MRAIVEVHVSPQSSDRLRRKFKSQHVWTSSVCEVTSSSNEVTKSCSVASENLFSREESSDIPRFCRELHMESRAWMRDEEGPNDSLVRSGML